jgi:uncharacterized protein with HEPN domain
MLEMLADIRRQLRFGREVFSRESTVQKAVAYDLIILGEAARKVSKRTQNANPGVPWNLLVNYRNELIHEYGQLDLESTWQFVQSRLPRLEHRLRKARVAMPEP